VTLRPQIDVPPSIDGGTSDFRRDVPIRGGTCRIDNRQFHTPRVMEVLLNS